MRWVGDFYSIHRWFHTALASKKIVSNAVPKCHLEYSAEVFLTLEVCEHHAQKLDMRDGMSIT